MRILFSAQFFLNQVGGAEISLQTLLKRLAKRHEVHVLSTGTKGTYLWEGITVHEVLCPNNILYINLLWSIYLNRLEFKPDLVITQINAAAPTIFWAKGRGIPCLFYVRSFEHFCLDSFKHKNVFECDRRCSHCEGAKGLILQPAYGLIYSRNKKALQEADLVVAQTTFMQDVVQHYSGRKCDVVPNPIDLASVAAEKSGDDILFVKPLKHKGVALVAELAKRLPKRTFVLAGELDPDYQWLAKEPNVNYLGILNDMRAAYGKARILLVPSDMADSSPRVIAEAMSNGIPCITSDEGGAAEMGGDAAVKLPVSQPESWVNEIERLYTNEEYYRGKSAKSREHAKTFTLETSLKRLDKLVQEKLGLKL